MPSSQLVLTYFVLNLRLGSGLFGAQTEAHHQGSGGVAAQDLQVQPLAFPVIGRRTRGHPAELRQAAPVERQDRLGRERPAGIGFDDAPFRLVEDQAGSGDSLKPGMSGRSSTSAMKPTFWA